MLDIDVTPFRVSRSQKYDAILAFFYSSDCVIVSNAKGNTNPFDWREAKGVHINWTIHKLFAEVFICIGSIANGAGTMV